MLVSRKNTLNKSPSIKRIQMWMKKSLRKYQNKEEALKF